MLRLMRRAIAGAVVGLVLLAAPAALAQSPPPAYYDGQNPFACTLQQLGTGTDYPDPNADPLCVEFDKTHQNVTELGIVDFLSKEPARVAAASPKCFYFQRDHWTSSIQDGQQPELYHWDGSYFFDKAQGRGGVFVENFRLGGVPMDPTTLPGFPDEYKQFFAGGKGGVQQANSVPADPQCATKPGPGSGTGGSGGGSSPYSSGPNDGCRVPGGRVGKGIGGVRLGMKRRSARAELGKAAKESARYMSWCFDGGGRLVAGLGAKGDTAPVELVLTDSSAFDARGFRVGDTSREARKRMRHERRVGRAGGAVALCAVERTRRLCAGVARGRVTWIAVTRKRLSQGRALRLLRGVPAG
jgi:hypothetical protein